ncbi:MAG: DedA family protein [Chloroflexota bacterium]
MWDGQLFGVLTRVAGHCGHPRSGQSTSVASHADGICRAMHDGHTLGILSQVDGIWLYVAIFLLILIQECGVPLPFLPSEVVLLGGGFLAADNRFALIVMGITAASATLLGNSALFMLSRRFGRVALDRYGKYVHMHTERVDRIERWIERRGSPILFYGPLLPILRAYMPALAGMFGVPYRAYIGILTGAALIWTFGMLIIGSVMGVHWFDAVSFMRHNITIAAVVIVTVGATVLLILRWTRGIALAGDADGSDEPAPSQPHDGTTLRLTLHGMEWKREEGAP